MHLASLVAVVIIGSSPTWSTDSQLLTASSLLSSLRSHITSTLGYTLSCGLASNKTLAKVIKPSLSSEHHRHAILIVSCDSLRSSAALRLLR